MFSKSTVTETHTQRAKGGYPVQQVLFLRLVSQIIEHLYMIKM